jgi:putative ABC transport system permease protein
MINETLARMMGGDSVVGRQMTFWENPGEIIGVLKDFHFLPMTEPIGPMVFLIDQTRLWQMTIRLSPDDPTSALAYVRETWEKNVPSYPFEYSYLTDDLKMLYSEAADMGKLLGLFAGLALFVASLGMLGLAACAAAARSKEIAIRKVLGAGAASTVSLLGKELATCLLIANLIAWPAGYLLMNKWLQEYNSRIDIGPGLLLIPLLVTVLAAGIAVSYQTLKAVRANPIGPLKYE